MSASVPTGEDVPPLMKISVWMGPTDVALMVTVFHELGKQPWRGQYKVAFRGHSPPAHTPCTHPCNRLWTPAWCPRTVSSLRTETTSLCFPKIVAREHSLGTSARWSALTERPVVMEIVKISSLQDSHLYRECHIERRKWGGWKSSPEVHTGYWTEEISHTSLVCLRA